MRVIEGNVWDLLTGRDALVVPTNCGWRRNGTAIMGRGLARQAAFRFKGLESDYGWACREYRSKLTAMPGKLRDRSGIMMALVMFPTKLLNSQKPWLSWQNPANLELIERGLQELRRLGPGLVTDGSIYLPLLGCGEGGLDPEIVTQLLHAVLIEDMYVLVKLKV